MIPPSPMRNVVQSAREIKEYENAFLTQQISFLETIHEYFTVNGLRHDPVECIKGMCSAIYRVARSIYQCSMPGNWKNFLVQEKSPKKTLLQRRHHPRNRIGSPWMDKKKRISKVMDEAGKLIRISFDYYYTRNETITRNTMRTARNHRIRVINRRERPCAKRSRGPM